MKSFIEKLEVVALFLLLLVGLSSQVKADEHYGNFFTTQPPLEYVFDAALTADMLTTAQIKNQHYYVETNPILGQHPSDAKIAAYGLGVAALHAAITYEMVSQDVPKGIVTAWECVTIGVEVGYVVHNYKLGLRIKF